jgi:glycosyltransferase involved in cell wall biosynthesis
MKVLLFTQCYPPDIGAQSSRIDALVKALLNRYHKVRVITTEPHRYSAGEKIEYKKEEKYSNFEICRIKSGKHNDKFWRRPINYIISMINSLIHSLKLKNKEKYDLIFATSPPITTAVTAFICNIFKKSKFILEVRDLWPDSLVVLKIINNKLVISLLFYIEKLLYKKAMLIIVVSEDMRNKIISKGVNKNKIIVFTNGIDKEFILENTDIKRKKK